LKVGGFDAKHCKHALINFAVEEAATRLGSDREFVTRLVEWSGCEEHPGVKGEGQHTCACSICAEEMVLRNK